MGKSDVTEPTRKEGQIGQMMNKEKIKGGGSERKQTRNGKVENRGLRERQE